VALRASLSSLERTGGATWILEAVGRPICPLRFAADHDIQTRYELPGGSTSKGTKVGRELRDLLVVLRHDGVELARLRREHRNVLRELVHVGSYAVHVLGEFLDRFEHILVPRSQIPNVLYRFFEFASQLADALTDDSKKPLIVKDCIERAARNN